MADRASLFMRLVSTVMDGPADRPLAWRVCAGVRELMDADGVSMTLDNPSAHRVTLCASDERSGELENLQDVLGEGPCRDAFSSQLPVSTGVDREAAGRWPNFIPAAERIVGPDGILWSVPMHSDGEVIGTLSFHRLSGTVPAETMDAAQILADGAAMLLLNDPAAKSQDPGAAGWAARAVVHRAVGKLMVQLGLGPDDALAVLRSRAFTADAQLAQIAQNVLDGTLDLTDC